ncbi:serine/threonine-protein kinase [Streptomyces collinus]|uniref:serine/threonine-protein kinase n=1 Tax=Streptomyces collinus TaxID=42684 RepID=UPI002942F8DF|nr:serine/threonine-protein kinase [Streptomyces collinus]
MIGVCVQRLLTDRYQLEERLGRGAMGEVWRAADQLLGRFVAVKILHTEQAEHAERFRMEAQTAGRLNHPNVVGMYDFGSHHDQLYLVMELVDGWSLAQERSLRGALNPQDAAAVAAQVAAGLAAAHQQGVIHRDVKPANVLLTGDRTAKIADFGIARFADEAASALTATGKIRGTADYLAPERVLGRPAKPASDVYSLGCVLYELLTGKPPFRGATSLAVVQQHVNGIPAPPSRLRPEIPQQLSDYVLLLLAKDPAHRPTAEQAAYWLAGSHRTPTPPAPRSMTITPAPPTAPAPVPRSRPSRSATHSRPRGRRRLATQATLCGIGLALFAAAAALGASMRSGEGAPSSPSSPTPATGTSVPATRTPSPLAASSAAPARSVPPARERDDDQDHESRDKHGRGKGKRQHSDD